jgi:hypothetical protein
MTFDPTFLLVICVVCFVVLRITRTLRGSNRQPWHSELWFTHLYWNHTLQRHVIARAQTLTDAQRKVKPYAIGKPASQHSKASSLSTVQITTQRLASPPVYAHIWGALSILAGGVAEVSGVIDGFSGVNARIKPDYLTDRHIVDLKTCVDGRQDAFCRSVMNLDTRCRLRITWT